jgi:hypothetical protein
LVHRDVENPLRLVFIEQWAALSDSPPSLEMFTATPAGGLAVKNSAG